MPVFVNLIKSPYLLWLLLAIPSKPFLIDLVLADSYYSEMMHRSGVISIQLLVFTLLISPVLIVLKKLSFTKHLSFTEQLRRWLLKSRRYFGVASFLYAFIHLLLYVRETYYLTDILEEALTWKMGAGWIAVIFFIPLVLTSNNRSMKKLANKWKLLQRLAYLVVVASFVHWLSLDLFFDLGLQWLAILVFAKSIQLYFYQPTTAASPKPAA
jgi:sulfoxide reductase heme-binding subunit YedZ